VSVKGLRGKNSLDEADRFMALMEKMSVMLFFF